MLASTRYANLQRIMETKRMNKHGLSFLRTVESTKIQNSWSVIVEPHYRGGTNGVAQCTTDVKSNGHRQLQ